MIEIICFRKPGRKKTHGKLGENWGRQENWGRNTYLPYFLWKTDDVRMGKTG